MIDLKMRLMQTLRVIFYISSYASYLLVKISKLMAEAVENNIFE